MSAARQTVMLAATMAMAGGAVGVAISGPQSPPPTSPSPAYVCQPANNVPTKAHPFPPYVCYAVTPPSTPGPTATPATPQPTVTATPSQTITQPGPSVSVLFTG